jgi:hypothetical protein
MASVVTSALALADLHAGADRLRPEGGEQRREGHAGLQRAEAGANTGRQLRRGTQLFGFLDGIPHQQSSLPASIAAAVRAGIDVRQRNGREAVPRSGLAG